MAERKTIRRRPEEHQRFTEAKTAMLLHQPFFASLLLDRMRMHVGKFPDIFPPGNETAATNGKDIWFDEDFLTSLKLPEAVFLIAHEVGHAMWMHLERFKYYQDMGFDGEKFSHELANVAADYVINDLLVKAHVGDIPQVALHSSQYTCDMQWEEVYRELRKQQKQNGGNPPPNQGGKGSKSGPLDHHIPANSEASEMEWKQAVAAAADAAKAQGNLPQELERFVQKLLNPQVPWQEKLRVVLTRAAARDAHTWAKPHRRRLINQGVVLPSYTGFGAGEIVVAIDTSGSIGQLELEAFLSELQSILDVAKPERVWCFGIDAKVHTVTELAPGENLLENPPPLGGGGGTSFIPAFEWVEEEGIEPAALVYFTDMHGAFPSAAPSYPTIWCSTTEVDKAPFGEVIQVDLSGYEEK